VETSRAEFQLRRSRSMEIKVRFSSTPLSEPIFTKRPFVQKYTEFHKIRTTVSVADTRSRFEKRTDVDFAQGVLVFFVNNALIALF